MPNHILLFTGNIIVMKSCLVQKAFVGSINIVPMSSIFTLHTPQTVQSQVLFTRIHVPHLYTNSTNGIHFDTDIVLTTSDSTIEGMFAYVLIVFNMSIMLNRIVPGPVTLQQCTIGQLTLAEAESDSAFARHIVGTRLEDLSQIYSGKVTINGTLQLADVILDRPRKSSIFVNGLHFALLDVSKHFWMKHTDQHIPRHVRFLQPVRTSQIFVDTAINTHPIAEHLLTTTRSSGIADVGPVNLVFHAATIQGNLYTDRSYKTTVSMLNEQCVRHQDTAVRMASHLSFTGQLTVDHFYSNTDNYTSELAIIGQHELQGGRLQLNSVRHFKQLTVLGGPVRVTSDQLEVITLNGLDLMTGLQSIARITEPTTLDELIVKGTVQVSNLSLGLLDDIEFDRMSKRITDGIQLNTLHIGGEMGSHDVQLSTFSDIYVRRINGIDVDEYLAKVVTIRGPQQRRLRGQKRYMAGLIVHDLTVSRLNELDMTEWFDNVLHTRRAQQLTGEWNIEDVTADIISVSMINEVPLAELVDSAVDVVEIQSDVAVAELVHVYGDVLAADTDCDLERVRDTLRQGLILSNWRQIVVNGLTTWLSSDAVTPIARLFTYGVTTHSDQIIFADIRFEHRTAQFDNISISTLLINTIDVQQIFSDALLSSDYFQAIHGEKRFVSGVSMRSATAAHNFRTPFWNGCDLLQLNASLFRINRDQEITGTKRFLQTPSVYQLHIVGGNINDVSIEDIACAGEGAAVTILPSVALLGGMHVIGQLGITTTLNYMPVDVMLTGRVRLLSETQQDVRGVLTFEHLVIRGGRLAGTVNNITVADVVLRSGDVEQALHGRKSVHGTVWLSGPAVVTQLNGVDVIQAFGRSIRLDATSVRLSRLQVLNNVVIGENDDLTVLDQLNDVDVVGLMYWQPPNADDLQPIHREILTAIGRAEQKVNTDLVLSDGSVVYMDYASDIRIQFVNVSQAEKRNDAVFIDTWTPCGRSAVDDHGVDNDDDNSQCSCPVQNVVVTSHKYQISVTRAPLFARNVRLTGRNGNVTIITRFAPIACAKTELTPATTAHRTFTTATLLSEKCQHISSDLFRDTTTTIVQDVLLFEQDVTSLIVMNFVNGSVQAWRHEDGMEWLDQGLIEHTRSINHMCVLSWQNYNLLLALSSPLTSTNGSSSVLGEGQLFFFDGTSFMPLVSGTINGDYDQCDSVYIEQSGDLMLLLAKQGSDVVTVFKTVEHMKYLVTFELLQTIVVAEGLVHSVVSLQLIGKRRMYNLRSNVCF